MVVNAGKVGIGIINPAQKLEINGNVISSGTITATGVITAGSGTNQFYYCNGGVSIGNLCRGNGCSCVAGAWVAISLKTD